TIGIRYTEKKRMIMERHSEVVHTKYGDVNVKVSEGYGAKKIKPEYEDLKRIANEKNIAFQDIKDIIYKNKP
ncbi:MAG: LarC family nickel insertion protein, partial [Lachnospiraceae bacterium]|nr:LarC family nickel insertion protein [Lachnospiraceae bacterium]